MILSMTGFGRGEFADGKRNITVEIKSVNHRYSDIQVRMPRRYSFVEDAVKSAVKEYITRGKIDVSVNVTYNDETDISIGVNKALAKEYVEGLEGLKSDLGLSGDISIELISNMPEVLKQVSEDMDEDEIKKSFLAAVSEAGEKFNEMREEEGKRLAEDLLPRADYILEKVAAIEVEAGKLPGIYKEKLRARLNDLLEGVTEIPEERLAQEAAVFADKADITEEITRLKSHMSQMKAIIGDDNKVNGKKLDFLVQEMNREANTIGSKANDLAITEDMLLIKSEIEKIREQVQNIE